jgi:hypothetical protein
LRNSFVLVLASGVPDLHLDLEPVNITDLVYKIESNRHHVIVNELALRVSQQDVGLSHAAVANYDNFL